MREIEQVSCDFPSIPFFYFLGSSVVSPPPFLCSFSSFLFYPSSLYPIKQTPPRERCAKKILSLTQPTASPAGGLLRPSWLAGGLLRRLSLDTADKSPANMEAVAALHLRLEFLQKTPEVFDVEAYSSGLHRMIRSFDWGGLSKPAAFSQLGGIVPKHTATGMAPTPNYTSSFRTSSITSSTWTKLLRVAGQPMVCDRRLVASSLHHPLTCLLSSSSSKFDRHYAMMHHSRAKIYSFERSMWYPYFCSAATPIRGLSWFISLAIVLFFSPPHVREFAQPPCRVPNHSHNHWPIII